MTAIEIKNGGPNDGARLDVPDDVVALILITERDGDYLANWVTRRTRKADESHMSAALHRLLTDAGWVIVS